MANAQYSTYFMIRRLLTNFTLVVLSKAPFFQCQILMVFSTINLIYLISSKPMNTRLSNWIEIFNETCVVASTHIVNILLNAAVPTEFRAQVGWVLIGVAVLNIVTNLAITIYSSIVDVYNDNVEKRRT